MTQQEFKSTLQMLVPMIVVQAARIMGQSEDEIIPLFYGSRLYADLEREETKLWHLSPLALAELWDEERKTHKIVYPEEA